MAKTGDRLSSDDSKGGWPPADCEWVNIAYTLIAGLSMLLESDRRTGLDKQNTQVFGYQIRLFISWVKKRPGNYTRPS